MGILEKLKSAVGVDGDTPNKAPTLPPGVSVPVGKCSVVDKMKDFGLCMASKETKEICASCSQSCSCKATQGGDPGDEGNDLFDQITHMGKKVGKQLEESKAFEEATQHTHQVIQESQKKTEDITHEINKLKREYEDNGKRDSSSKTDSGGKGSWWKKLMKKIKEAVAKKAELTEKAGLAIAEDQIKMTKATIGTRIEEIEKKIKVHAKHSAQDAPELT